jgi:hypothetical protein
MNISNIDLKLFKVGNLSLSIYDELGEHIGNYEPKKGDDVGPINLRRTLYVIGKSMKQVADYLDYHGIKSVKIIEIDTALDAREVS